MTDTENLWCDNYDSRLTEWTEVGDSPYLSDDITDYVKETTNNQEEGDFHFADSGGSGTINSVTLKLECRFTGAGFLYNFKIEVYVWDGSSWQNAGKIQPDETYYSYEDLDLSAILDSWAKIDGAEIYLKAVDKLGTATVYARRAYLHVDYTPAVVAKKVIGDGLTCVVA